MLLLNPIEPPWYGPVCQAVWEGRGREAPSYPDQWPLCRHRHKGHYAGAEHRLNREVAKRYHENQACRAEEELIAELAAAMMGAHLGFTGDHLDDHARYIGSWIRALRADKRLILKAAAEAQRAVDWMFEAADISDSQDMTRDAA